MATQLFLYDTADSPITGYRGMDTVRGGSNVTGITTTTNSGTEIQWTKTAGGAALVWISGRVPLGGFTLAGTMTFNIWGQENSLSTNAGGRARVFKWSLGAETEVLGGPWSKGAEFNNVVSTVQNWTGTPTSTAFLEDDRLIVKYYATNIGTMASGTTTLSYNGASAAAAGDSYFQITETVALKTETMVMFPPWPPRLNPLLIQ